MALPRSTPRREIIRKFRALGWEGPIQARTHQFMKQGNRKVRIPNPHGEDIDISLLAEILRQAGITDEEWIKA